MYRAKNGGDKNIEHVLAKERTYNIVKTVMIGFALLLTLAYVGYQINSATNKIKADNAKTRDYINCIVKFFTQPDRASKQIANIETCRVETSSAPPTPSSTAFVPTPKAATLSSSVTTASPLAPQSTIPQTKNTPAPTVTKVEPPIQFETRLNPITLKIEVKYLGDTLWQEL